jgi:E3 ubiquitin-protein ligase UHRF1
MKCSDDHGDRPRPLPVIKEIKDAIDITERKGSPSWDYDVSYCSFALLLGSYGVLLSGELLIFKCKMFHFDSQEEKSCWMWKKCPPPSRKQVDDGDSDSGKRTRKPKRQAKNMSVKQKLLKGISSCLIHIY